jgi:hypothetical protein
MSYAKIDLTKCIEVSKDAASPWDGEKRTLYRVPLELLHYNIENGRIATWISGYRASHANETPLEEMPVDELNQIISEFIKNSSSKAKYDNTYRDIAEKGQIVMGAILDDGTVVSGNRRFTVLRELLHDKGNRDKYGYFLCNIFPVPRNGEEKREIKRLETKTQFNEDSPVDYGPIDRLVDIYTNVLVNDPPFTEENYRTFLNLKKGEMHDFVCRAQILIDYLTYIGQPQNYDIARVQKLDGPINELAHLARRCGEERWNEIKPTFFQALKVTEDKGGDKTRIIRQLIKSYSANPADFNKLKTESEANELDEDRASFGVQNDAQPVDEATRSDQFADKMNKFIAHTSNDSARRKPITQLATSYDDMIAVDCDAIPFMSVSEKAEIANELTKIETRIFEIRKTLKK